MTKLERLLNLIAALLDAPRPLTARELQERVVGYPDDLTAFRRAFERDKEDLRTLGVPLAVEPAPGHDPPVDGYRIDRDEYGAELHLEPDELAALHVASNLAHLQDGVESGRVKLAGMVAEEPEDRPAAGDEEALAADVAIGPRIPTLVAAAADHRAVAFAYRGERREIEPWRVSFARGHWYVEGFDRGRDAPRLFRVDRIDGSVEDAGEAVHEVGELTDPAELRAWEFGDGEGVEARVLLDVPLVEEVRRLADRVEPAPGGGAVASFTVRDERAFWSLLVGFLERAELVAPPELRERYLAWLRHGSAS
ncbi:MAG: WYL domain-containing protein [Actinomyces sp.]|nr:MAG: WYL domain-containing protein [Actinomyces sp.]